jgi:hypothetical protein
MGGTSVISDKANLMTIIDDIERGLVCEEYIRILRQLVERLDEMDDLVDTVCSCRTQDIPVVVAPRAVADCDCWPECMCTPYALCGECT